MEAPVIAGQILENYKRDRSYFEQYSTKFDDEFLNQLKERINDKCVWEIQRNCRKLVDEMELHVDVLIDKGFVLRILNDFNQLADVIETIVESVPAVLGEHDPAREEYSIERMMTQTQFRRSESQ